MEIPLSLGIIAWIFYSSSTHLLDKLKTSKVKKIREYSTQIESHS